MSGLPNLQKLIEQATPGPWRERGELLDKMLLSESGIIVADLYCPNPQDAALIAAAPALAELLIECEQALAVIANPNAAKARQGQPHPSAVARAALARLADYDKEIA